MGSRSWFSQLDAQGKRTALTKFVNFNFSGKDAKKHVRILNKYGKLIYPSGEDWNGLSNAGTQFYKARNKKVLKAGIESNGAGKGFPLLKGFFVPKGSGRARMRKDGSLVFSSESKTEQRKPLDAALLEAALYMDDDDEARKQIRAMVDEVTTSMGDVDLFSIQNGLGSEMTDGGYIATDATAFANNVEKLWKAYGDKKGHEFHRWAPVAIGRVIKDKQGKGDVIKFVNALAKAKKGNRAMMKKFKRRLKDQAAKRKKADKKK